jgi:SEC-C motif domain protein
MRCPCRKKTETEPYAACCAPYHQGTAALTAEALMRSRYTAFTLADMAYIGATWHPSTRPAALDATPGQVWLSLKIVAAATVGDRATVAFAARSRIGGTTHVLTESSRFIRESGRWLYVDGDVAG